MGGLRRTVRRLRFFYKPDSRELYREHLAGYGRTLLFPFVGGGRAVFKDGTEVHIPRPYIDMLATCCRLRAIGATPAWRQGEMEVEFRGHRFLGPPDTKMMPLSLQGFLVDDAYRIGGEALSGKTVMDVGGHIGVFAVSCAIRGALVHVFEPFPLFQEYIRKNTAANGVLDRVIVHGVGLSDRDRIIDGADALAKVASSSHGGGGWGEKGLAVSFVQAVDYLHRRPVGEVHLLKMNCEGSEYALLDDKRFLDLVRPERIAMQYHRGGEPIYAELRRRGYEVNWGDGSPERRARNKGWMFARQ
jgi:FkbM family methyltransferase